MDKEEEDTEDNKIKKATKKKKEIKDFSSIEVSVVTALFIPEKDLLMVSQSNNKITAWKIASANEIFNANQFDSKVNDKTYFTCPVLMTNTVQLCMTWDSSQKALYTGQKHGKIFKWNLKSKRPAAVLDVNNSKRGNDEFGKKTEKKNKLPKLFFCNQQQRD